MVQEKAAQSDCLNLHYHQTNGKIGQELQNAASKTECKLRTMSQVSQ